MPLKFFAALFILACLWLPVDNAGAEEFTVSFETSPDAAYLVPWSAPAAFTLAIKAIKGQPAADGWVRVQLDAPPPSGFLSTDYSAVEGSRLLELRLPIIDGKAEWRQVLPIRGQYRLAAQFTGAAGAKAEKVFTFQVRENNQKWGVLIGFALGLFITGVVAGRIFSAPRHRVAAMLALWLLLSGAYYALTGHKASAQETQKRKYFSKIEVASPRVGTPARVQWWLCPASIGGKLSAKLAVTITQVEKNLMVFAAEKIPVAGEFSLDYQFTDGSDHRVTVVAETEDGETIRQEQLVSVMAVAPPLRAQLAVLASFLLVIFLGLLAGRWSRKASAK